MDLTSGLNRERPLATVPKWIMLMLCAALVMQVTYHALRPRPVPVVKAMPPAPSVRFLDLMSMGEQAALSRVLMLWLQAFDYQPGVSVPFKALNYHRIIAWLDAILSLDPRSHYPLLSAVLQRGTGQRQAAHDAGFRL